MLATVFSFWEDLWSTPFLQRALLELLLLGIIGGVLGSWIVTRRLVFYSHSVGAGVFPGLVVAAPWKISAQIGAFFAAVLFAGSQWQLSKRIAADAATGLLLVAVLAIGIILASDVYHSGSQVDSQLFGSVIGISEEDILLTAVVVAGLLTLNVFFYRLWIASAFDSKHARYSGLAVSFGDAIFLIAVAAAIVIAVKAVGALLLAAILVIPAVTARLFTRRVLQLQIAGVILACLEGIAALWLAQEFNVAVGPVLAALGGVVFCLSLLGSYVSRPASKGNE